MKNLYTDLKERLSRLDHSVANEALMAITALEREVDLQERTVQLTTRSLDAAMMASGLGSLEIDEELAQTFVHTVVGKYRVSDHFCLTPADVAKLINHVTNEK